MFQMPGKLRRGWLRMKWPLLDVLHATVLSKGMLRMRPGGRLIGYHNIDAAGETKFNTRFISEAAFETQLKWFKDHCHVVSLQDYWIGNFPNDRLTVSLTFDDGLANNYHRAMPLLVKHNIPASFYITPIWHEGYDILWPDLIDLVTPFLTAPVKIGNDWFVKSRKQILVNVKSGVSLKHIGRSAPWKVIQAIYAALLPHATFRDHHSLDDYWRLLSESQIREMAATPGITIGSHGLRHCSLGKIELADAIHELKTSKEILEQITGKEVNSIAWPDGSYARETVDAASVLGYRHQLASDFFFEADQTDNRLRARFGMNPFISWKNQQVALLKGGY